MKKEVLLDFTITNIYLRFKNEEIHNNKNLLIETRYPIPNENILVLISDFTMEDGAIKKDWQLPLYGVKDIGNPKIKCLSLEEFKNTFEILCYESKDLFCTEELYFITKLYRGNIDLNYKFKTPFIFEGKPHIFIYSNTAP